MPKGKPFHGQPRGRRVFDPYRRQKPGQGAHFWNRMLRSYGPPTPGVMDEVKAAFDQARREWEAKEKASPTPVQEQLL